MIPLRAPCEGGTVAHLPDPIVVTRSLKFDWCDHEELQGTTIHGWPANTSKIGVFCVACATRAYFWETDLRTERIPELNALALVTGSAGPSLRILFDHALERTHVPST